MRSVRGEEKRTGVGAVKSRRRNDYRQTNKGSDWRRKGTLSAPSRQRNAPNRARGSHGSDSRRLSFLISDRSTRDSKHVCQPVGRRYLTICPITPKNRPLHLLDSMCRESVLLGCPQTSVFWRYLV